MRQAIDIVNALFCIFAGVWALLYYTGWLSYTGDQEKKRRERIRKYGWVILGCGGVLLVCGVALFLLTFT